jgi:hypothetical protein
VALTHSFRNRVLLDRVGPRSLRTLMAGISLMLGGMRLHPRRQEQILYRVMWTWFSVIRKPTAPLRVLPNVILVGASKSGTSALSAYLAQHHSFSPPFFKEPHFFNRDVRKGLPHYRAFFPTMFHRWMLRVSGRQLLTGEFTPSYYYCPHAPRQIREQIGDIKILLMLRNPIDRAFSHYKSAVLNGLEQGTFEEALAKETERVSGEYERMRDHESYHSLPFFQHAYVRRGFYADYLPNWLECFSPENILILIFEDFINAPEAILGQACRFLNLEPLRLQSYPKINASPSEETCDPATRERLEHVFRPSNERLRHLLGRPVPWT